MTETRKTSFIRYFGLYAGAYIVGMVILAILAYIIGRNIPGMNIVLSMVSAQIVVYSFFKREKRSIDLQDRNRLIKGSLITTIILDTLPVLVLLIPGVLSEAIPGAGELDTSGIKFVLIFTIVVLLVVWLINFFVLRWIYGSWATKQYHAYQEKHGNIGDVFD